MRSPSVLVFEESRQKLRLRVSRSRHGTRCEVLELRGSEGPTLVLCEAQPNLV